MVEILALDYPANVVLLPGATQHWRDLTQAPVAQTSIISALVDPHIADGASVLVVGAHDVEWLRRLAARTELTVLVRCIPDASDIATALSGVTVYCGDPASLPETVAGFDVVVAATDLGRVLPLESEARPWASLYTDVTSRARQGGVTVVGIENDLGMHRLNGPANPRSRSWDRDWAPMATWDASRPRTSAQVAALADGPIWVLYPEWEKVTAAHTGELTPEATVSRDAAVLDAAVLPLFGPDPAWYVQAAAAAGHTADWAAGWLLVAGAVKGSPTILRETRAHTVGEVSAAPNATARSLLGALSDALAAQNLTTIRDLLQGWGRWVHATNAPASFGTTLVDAEGNYSTFGGREDVGPTTWQALGELVAIIRGRGWRVPWPSPTSDEEMLSLLGAMAKLGELGPDELSAAIVEIPQDPDALRRLDRQELVALVGRNNEQLHALRSRLRWNELQFVSTKVINKSKAVGKRGVRFAKRGARKALSVAGLSKRAPVVPAEADRDAGGRP